MKKVLAALLLTLAAVSFNAAEAADFYFEFEQPRVSTIGIDNIEIIDIRNFFEEVIK